jgi:hypothetical protein
MFCIIFLKVFYHFEIEKKGGKLIRVRSRWKMVDKYKIWIQIIFFAVLCVTIILRRVKLVYSHKKKRFVRFFIKHRFSFFLITSFVFIISSRQFSTDLKIYGKKIVLKIIVNRYTHINTNGFNRSFYHITIQIYRQ